MFTTLVYAFTWLDSSDPGGPDPAGWERFLERVWAVVVIDYIWSNLAGISVQIAFAEDLRFAILGMLGIVLSVLLIFTDASAAVDDDVNAWTVLPQAFLRSLRAATKAAGFARALALFSLQLLLAEGLAVAAASLHADAAFWTQALALTLATPPLAILTAVIFRDMEAA